MKILQQKCSVLLIPLGLECPYTLQCTFGQQRVINPKDLKQDNAYEPVTEKKENKDTTEPPAGALQPPVKWR